MTLEEDKETRRQQVAQRRDPLTSDSMLLRVMVCVWCVVCGVGYIYGAQNKGLSVSTSYAAEVADLFPAQDADSCMHSFYGDHIANFNRKESCSTGENRFTSLRREALRVNEARYG
jgi:hypothetical protein